MIFSVILIKEAHAIEAMFFKGNAYHFQDHAREKVGALRGKTDAHSRIILPPRVKRIELRRTAD